MKTKQLLLGMILSFSSFLSIAQPSEVTDAAMAFQSSQSALYSGKIERFIEKILDAKKSITEGEAKEDGKTHPKTYQYLTQINFELLVAISIGNEPEFENEELNKYKDDSEKISNEMISAYKKCKKLDTKKKKHIKELNNYLLQKLSMINNQARTAFDMKQFDAAFLSFGSAAEISKILESKDSITFNQNAIASVYNYYDTMSKQEKFKDALPLLESAYKLYPKNENVVKFYITSLIKTDEKEKAKKTMNEAVKNAPKNTNLIYEVGIIYSENFSNDKKGIEILKEGVKNNPDNYNLNYLTAVLIYNEGSEINNKISKLDLNDPKEAELKERKKNIFASAVPYFEACRKTKPESKFLIKSLFTCYRAAGMKEKAIEMKKLMQ